MDLENRRLEVSKRLIARNRRKREVNTFKEFNKPLQMKIEFTDFSPTPEELSYHRFLLQHPCPSKYRKMPWIRKHNYRNIKISCMIGYMSREHTYIDLKAPMNIMSRLYYNWIMNERLSPRKDPYNPNRLCNFVRRVKGVHIFVGNFTYQCDYVILEDVRGIIDPHLGEMVLGQPFVETTKMYCDHGKGIVQFTDGIEKITFMMPHMRKELKDIKNLPIDEIRPYEIKDNEIDDDVYYDRRRTYYSGCMNLGPEYKRDENWVKCFESTQK